MDMDVVKAIGCVLHESDYFGGWKIIHNECSSTLRSQKCSAGVIEIRKVDMMYRERKDMPDTSDGEYP